MVEQLFTATGEERERKGKGGTIVHWEGETEKKAKGRRLKAKNKGEMGKGRKG